MIPPTASATATCGRARRSWAPAVAAAILGAVVIGCSDDGADPTAAPREDAAARDDQAAAGEDTGRWGPVAVFRVDVANIGGPASSLKTVAGRLRIGEDCVTLERDGAPAITLYWLERRDVAWDAQAGRIVFTDQGDRTQLEDGDHISVTLTEGHQPDSREESYWLAEPADACPERGWTVLSAHAGE